MNQRSISSLLGALTLTTLATLAAPAPAFAQGGKPGYDAESKRIANRYNDDKKLCADENGSGARMQCLRDAKAEYEKSSSQARAEYNVSQGQSQACIDCGRVTSVVVGEKAGQSSAVGLIAGGVAGALLGNQVGSGGGRKLATVAGAAGGAYAGKKIEESAKSTKVWTVHVAYDNGKNASVNFDHDPGMHRGDRVQKSRGGIVRR